MIRRKNPFISVAFCIIFLGISTIHQLGAFPCCGAILGNNICIIGDIHAEYEPMLPEFATYISSIDTFMAHERRKSYQTAVILELPPHEYLRSMPITHAHFLRHIGQYQPSPHSHGDLCVIHADQRIRVLSAFEGLESFWQHYINRSTPCTLQDMIANPLKMTQHYTRHYVDACITDCFDDLREFLTQTKTDIVETFPDQTNPLLNLLSDLYQQVAFCLTRFAHFVNHVKDPRNTTILEAVVQKTTQQKSLAILEEETMGIPNGWFPQLELHLFNLCAALEICKNLQAGKRVVLVTGATHAFYLIYALTSQLKLPIMHITGFHASYNPYNPPEEFTRYLCSMLPPKDFETLLNTFCAIPTL